MMGSNNYLGLTHHPAVLAAGKQALERYGSGCTGSRLLNGTLDLHERLEHELAHFFGKEACLVFSTGYQANLGLISGLVGRGDVVFLDKLDHASIVDGAKMSYGETVRFNHGDLAALERKLQQGPPGTGIMIIVDGIYSMEGDIADVPSLLKLPQKYAAALPPANTAGVLAALDILQREPERRECLWQNTRRLQNGLRSLGFDIGPTETPIVPVLIGPLEKTFLFWRKLFEAGVFTNPVVPPAVPPSHCRLRTSLMATHTAQQIDHALEVFGRLGKELGVI